MKRDKAARTPVTFTIPKFPGTASAGDAVAGGGGSSSSSSGGGGGEGVGAPSANPRTNSKAVHSCSAQVVASRSSSSPDVLMVLRGGSKGTGGTPSHAMNGDDKNGGGFGMGKVMLEVYGMFVETICLCVICLYDDMFMCYMFI